MQNIAFEVLGDSAQPTFLTKVIRSGIWSSSAANKTALITGAALDGSSSEILALLRRQGFHVFCSDLEQGKDIDFVWDLENKPDNKWVSSFDLVVSCSVLEHVQRPYLACNNLTSVLKKDGLIYLSLPWVWRHHKYPDDYHRFHGSSIDYLCKDSRSVARAWSTSPDCKLYKYDPSLDQKLSRMIDGVKYLPYLMVHDARVKVQLNLAGVIPGVEEILASQCTCMSLGPVVFMI